MKLPVIKRRDGAIKELTVDGKPIDIDNLSIYEAAKLIHMRQAYLLLPTTLPGRIMSFNFQTAYQMIKAAKLKGEEVAISIIYS